MAATAIVSFEKALKVWKATVYYMEDPDAGMTPDSVVDSARKLQRAAKEAKVEITATHLTYEELGEWYIWLDEADDADEGFIEFMDEMEEDGEW